MGEDPNFMAEALQFKLESLTDLERAYVHVDYETSHRPEHFLEEGVVMLEPHDERAIFSGERVILTMALARKVSEQNLGAKMTESLWGKQSNEETGTIWHRRPRCSLAV